MAAVRAGLRRLLQEEREIQIDAAYRPYSTDSDEDRVGDAGLLLGAALLARDGPVAGEPNE